MRLQEQVENAVAGLELPFDALGFDPFGVSKARLLSLLPAAAAAYRWYFSVETRGIEQVPPRGRGMLVGNHSGGLPLDALMIVTACLLELKPPRLAQGMVDKFATRLPFVGTLLNRVGQLPGLPENAERLLEEERLLLVFPEGARGTAKLFPARHSLVDFGSGFVRLAQKTNTPIVPVAVLGGGDAFPTVANAYRLGHALGLPYVPIPAYGLPLVLPAKIEIEFGDPLRFQGSGAENDDVISGHVDTVKRALAEMLDRGARRRRGLSL